MIKITILFRLENHSNSQSPASKRQPLLRRRLIYRDVAPLNIQDELFDWIYHLADISLGGATVFSMGFR